MTLDNAIKHAEEMAEEKEQDRAVRKLHLDNRRSHNNIVHYEKACKCAEEHRQLAEWLKDYKRLLEQEPSEDVSDTNVGDIISRQAAIDALSYMCSEDENGITVSRANVNSMLRVLPPVTPQPKTGHWIRMKAYEKWGCSECHTVFRFTFKEHDYCPNCGIKMVEPQTQESEDKE